MDASRTLRIAELVLGLCLCLLGCTTKIVVTSPPAATEPAVPTPDAESTPDAEPEVPSDLVAFTDAEVQSLFDARCTKCHDPNNDLLDLTAPFTRETVGVATNEGQKRGFCAASERVTRIVAGDRDASLVWHKVKGTQDCGSPMPFDSGNKKLDAVELERFGLWIDALPKAD